MARKRRQSMREAWADQQAKMAALQADPGSPAARRKARIGGLVLIGAGLVLGGAMAIGFWQAGRIYVWLMAVPLALLGVGVWALITGKFPKAKRR
ncbi:MAG: hypothetical protein OEQ29_00545 [Alphaproteobacteria bacterium]|nr:hypothetical protein [Alphaproteobacteria bacterium]